MTFTSGNDNGVYHGLGFRIDESTSRAIGNMQKNATAVSMVNFDGTPEGNVSANPGSITFDRTNGVGYLKNTGTGNTGWVEISTGGGGGGGDNVFYFKASDFDAVELNYAALVVDFGTSRAVTRAFNDTTEEFVNFSINTPSNIDTSGTVTFRIWMYAATAAASRNVQLEFGHIPVSNSESWNQAYTDVNSGDIAIDSTQDDITEATWTETVSNLGWAANDLIICRLSRVNATLNDLSGDLNVIGFAVEIPRS